MKIAMITLTVFGLALTAPAQAQSADLEQRIEDARAMVREGWASHGKTIEAIEISYKCGLVEEFSAGVAMRTIQLAMDNEKNRAGLINDETMDIMQYTKTSVQAGKDSAQSGTCDRLTPALRGQLRTMVSSLVASFH